MWHWNTCNNYTGGINYSYYIDGIGDEGRRPRAKKCEFLLGKDMEIDLPQPAPFELPE